MTYGRVRVIGRTHLSYGAAVSHLAELVRGDLCVGDSEGPLIRPVSPEASLRLDGPPSPQGEKGSSGARALPQLPLKSC